MSFGYIFAKYINDRAKMGAYYTQEDVTGYIARSSIIRFLQNEQARKENRNAFNAETGIILAFFTARATAQLHL